MEKKGFVCLAVASLICLSLIYGCANSALLRVQPASDTKVFLKNIEESYDKYSIHALEWPVDEVSVIIFDPKDDNNTIETDGWTKVTSQEQFSEVMKRLDRFFLKQHFKIVGPKGDLYGYMLGGKDFMWIKTIDENTLKLFSTNTGRILRTPL